MSVTRKHYSHEEQLALVQNYFESGMSKYAFCKFHQISGCSVLRNWIKKYTQQEKTVSSPSEAITEEIAEDMANRSKDDYKEENAQLKKRIKELEKALEFSKLQTEARDLMITRAEEYFNIPIRKKIWGQAVTELVGQRKLKVALACRLFGHCRQAYYQSRLDIENQIKKERMLLDATCEIREHDPGIGGYKLWLMLITLFGKDVVPGRDSFYTLLRQHRLMLPPRKVRHTTNSNHRYHKWKNLIKGIALTSANELWVSDITYISLANGDVCYLHLITDAYSHKIVGWELADTLRVSVTISALNRAIAQAIEMKGTDNLNGLIHHSDRGIQYCCDQYVTILQKYHIAISMTEDYKPTDNAIAERINGIIKTEIIYRKRQFNDITHARNVIARYIEFYNNRRPHMSIDYKTPAIAHYETGVQKKIWKKKIYKSKNYTSEKNNVYLQQEETNQSRGLCL